MYEETARPLLLRGKVVQPDGTAPDRYMLIENGRITSISRRRPPRTQDALYVKTESEDWIFPGLLDLHTHATYNLQPLWEAPGVPYPNRFAWRGDAQYKNDVSALNRYLRTHGLDGSKEQRAGRGRTIATFSELQAVAGGTTTLQESYSLESSAGGLTEPVLCRSTANADDLGLPDEGKVLSVVDFFRPDDEGHPAPLDSKIEQYLANRDKGLLFGTLAHLAEGRSGLGSDIGVDPYSRAEFEMFMAHPAFADADAVRSSPFGIIHGCGIDVTDESHLDFLRERAISVIWSPVSNLLLYHETIDIEALMAGGVHVALGSDWSPSGSKHVWDEAKFARQYFQAIGSAVSDVQVFQMVTVNAAHCLGTEYLGRLVEGAMADLFILRSPLETDNALEIFFKTTDEHVRAVLIGGIPRYGDARFLKQFKDITLQPLPRREGYAVRGKRTHLPPDLTNEHGTPINVNDDINALEDLLKSAGPPLKPTKRSNILASSDKLYRHRINQLLQDTFAYGWQVDQSRYKRKST